VPLPDLETLRPLDAILISHAHLDHLDPRSLRKLAPECPAIAPPGCARVLRRGGIRETIEVAAGDRVEIGGTAIEVVPARHNGKRYPLGPRRPALGYLVEGPPSVYFAGDTDIFAAMAELAGRVEVAALPIWGWGPRVDEGHLDPERAAHAAKLIDPRIAVPLHWGTYTAAGPQTTEQLAAPARKFEAAVARQAPGVEVRVLAPGERLEL
jgi:L-ascorbate metabolism protein UlaG (beta-lactamase superfamily)